MKKYIWIMLLSVLLTACATSESVERDTEVSSSSELYQETESAEMESTEMESSGTEIETEIQTEEIDTELVEEITYTYTELSQTMYAKQSVNVRDLPCAEGNKLGSLTENQEVTVTGQCNETSWYRIVFDGKVAYVSDSYLSSEKTVSNSVPEEYRYYYDTDRDGLVSDAEIDAHDRRFYGDPPTSNETRTLLKSNYDQILGLTNAYTGELYYIVMVRADNGFVYASKLLDSFLLNNGLRSTGCTGGQLDDERTYAVVRNFMPIECIVTYTVHGDFTGASCGWPYIGEELYGITSSDVSFACADIGREMYSFLPKEEGHFYPCSCGENVQVVFTFDQIKAAIGIQ